MFCQNCGKKLIEQSLFCNYCGEKVAISNDEYDSSKQTKQPTATDCSTQLLKPTFGENSRKTEKKKCAKSKTKTIIILSIVTILCASFSFFISFYFTLNTDDLSPNETIDAFCIALAKNDIGLMQSYCLDTELSLTKKSFSSTNTTEDTEQELLKAFENFRTVALAKVQSKIVNSEVEENQATITVQFMFPDAAPVIEEFDDMLTSLVFFSLFSEDGVDIADNKIETKLLQTFIEKLNSESIHNELVQSEAAVMFNLKKINKNWKIVQISNAIETVYSCGFTSFTDCDGYTYTDVPIGDTISFATLELGVLNVKESETLFNNSDGSTFSANEIAQNTKFIMVEISIKNTTNTKINRGFDFPLYSTNGNSVSEFSDASWYLDEETSLSYVDLQPDITYTATLVYHAPADFCNYYILFSKTGTNYSYRFMCDKNNNPLSDTTSQREQQSMITEYHPTTDIVTEAATSKESEVNDFNPVGSYSDIWSGRPTMDILDFSNQTSTIVIEWANSANETMLFEFSGEWDLDTLTLTYDNCACVRKTYNEYTEKTTNSLIYKNGNGKLCVENGNIYWYDYTKNDEATCLFERLSKEPARKVGSILQEIDTDGASNYPVEMALDEFMAFAEGIWVNPDTYEGRGFLFYHFIDDRYLEGAYAGDGGRNGYITQIMQISDNEYQIDIYTPAGYAYEEYYDASYFTITAVFEESYGNTTLSIYSDYDSSESMIKVGYNDYEEANEFLKNYTGY